MKKRFFLLLLLFPVLASDAYALTSTDTIPRNASVNDALLYKKKAKTQERTGIMLLGSGVIMGGIGFGLVLSEFDGLFEPGAPPPKDYGSWPEILGYGGLILAVASIPFFILARKNKRRAKFLAGNKNIPSLYPGAMAKKQLFAGVVINF